MHPKLARTSPQVCRAHALARLHARCNARALVPRTHHITGPLWIYDSCTSSLEPKFCVRARVQTSPQACTRSWRERAPKFAERTRLRACTRVATRVRWCFTLTTSRGLFGYTTHAPVRWNPNSVCEPVCKRAPKRAPKVGANEPPSLPSARACALARALHARVDVSYSPHHGASLDIRLMHQFAGTQILCASCVRTSPQVWGVGPSWRKQAPKFAERTRLRACTRVATRVRWCSTLTTSQGLFGCMTPLLEPKFCVRTITHTTRTNTIVHATWGLVRANFWEPHMLGGSFVSCMHACARKTCTHAHACTHAHTTQSHTHTTRQTRTQTQSCVQLGGSFAPTFGSEPHTWGLVRVVSCRVVRAHAKHARMRAHNTTNTHKHNRACNLGARSRQLLGASPTLGGSFVSFVSCRACARKTCTHACTTRTQHGKHAQTQSCVQLGGSFTPTFGSEPHTWGLVRVVSCRVVRAHAKHARMHAHTTRQTRTNTIVRATWGLVCTNFWERAPHLGARSCRVVSCRVVSCRACARKTCTHTHAQHAQSHTHNNTANTHTNTIVPATWGLVRVVRACVRACARKTCTHTHAQHAQSHNTANTHKHDRACNLGARACVCVCVCVCARARCKTCTHICTCVFCAAAAAAAAAAYVYVCACVRVCTPQTCACVCACPHACVQHTTPSPTLLL